MSTSLLVLSKAALSTAGTLVIHQIQMLAVAGEHDANSAPRTRLLALHRFRWGSALRFTGNRRDLDKTSPCLGDKPTDSFVRMDSHWLDRFSVLGDERRLCTSGCIRRQGRQALAALTSAMMTSGFEARYSQLYQRKLTPHAAIFRRSLARSCRISMSLNQSLDAIGDNPAGGADEKGGASPP